MTTLHLRKSISQSSLRLGLPRVQPIWIMRGFLLILLALVCFALLPGAEAVISDPQGYFPGGNTAEGQNALFSLTYGGYNTAVGYYSLYSDTTGSGNTAIGAGTLLFNTADGNTATGVAVLLSNTTGRENTASGVDALFSNTTGSFNTATGAAALPYNTTGNQNTATGYSALFSNTTGHDNTATGLSALQSNTSGYQNTANGVSALQSNTGGDQNTATGYHALYSNIGGGRENTATGAAALQSNTTGNDNTATGDYALYATTGSHNIGLGFDAGANLTTGDNNIEIGNQGVAGEANTIRIGDVNQTACYIAGILGAPNFTDTVKIDPTTGQLGDQSSSARFKKDIDPMETTSEVIFSLRPVTFRYKNDKSNTPQFGLIAEEVAKVNPALIGVDKEGKPYCVQYDKVNAMLLNEFLKEHKKTETLEATVASLSATVKEQAAQIQKVSAQLEASKPAPQVVNNP